MLNCSLTVLCVTIFDIANVKVCTILTNSIRVLIVGRAGLVMNCYHGDGRFMLRFGRVLAFQLSSDSELGCFMACNYLIYNHA